MTVLPPCLRRYCVLAVPFAPGRRRLSSVRDILSTVLKRHHLAIRLAHQNNLLNPPSRSGGGTVGSILTGAVGRKKGPSEVSACRGMCCSPRDGGDPPGRPMREPNGSGEVGRGARGQPSPEGPSYPQGRGADGAGRLSPGLAAASLCLAVARGACGNAVSVERTKKPRSHHLGKPKKRALNICPSLIYARSPCGGGLQDRPDTTTIKQPGVALSRNGGGEAAKKPADLRSKHVDAVCAPVGVAGG